MAYSDSFPAIRPSFQFSADAGRLDPRISYSRSTTGTYFGTDKHLSSENLITNSEDFSAWTASNTTPTANAIAAPDGTTTADTITGTGTGSLQKTVQSNTISASYPVVSVYVKAGTHNFIQIQSNWSGSHYANFDVTSGAGAVGSLGGNTTATIQAVGSTGWYRCVCRYNAASMTPVIIIRLVDSGSAAYGATTASTGTVHLWGAMATNIGDLTNIVAYQSSTTQLHRAYAPTLQTAAINAPRFEHSATDSASEAIGSSRGLLIEGSVANVMAYSRNGFNASNAFQYTLQSGVTATESAAVGPSGSLDATLITEDSSTGGHQFQTTETVTSAAHTVSVYVKPVGVPSFGIRISSGSVYGSVFTFADESFTNYGIAPEASRIEPVGNGWYRLSITQTVTSGSSLIRFNLFDAGGSASYVGNGFNGILVWGFQCEANAFPSSWIDTGTSGSTATRAADSASMDLTQAGFNGGAVSIVGEFAPADASVAGSLRVMSLSDGSDTENIRTHMSNSRMYSVVRSGAVNTAVGYNSNALNDGEAVKFGLAVDTNSLIASTSGFNSLGTTGAVLPNGATRLGIAQNNSGAQTLDSHWQSIRVFGEPLSLTNLQALTS